MLSRVFSTAISSIMSGVWFCSQGKIEFSKSGSFI